MSSVKYPRTPHLPWSPGATADDIFTDPSQVDYGRVVITEKMDGENTTIYHDRVHSRSIDTDYHWSRTWVKNLQGQIGYLLPEDMRICGENLQAVHSIKYTALPSFFMGFSIWRDDRCLDWDETQDWFEALGISSVPVLARGHWEHSDVQNFIHNWKDDDSHEGYVIRLERSFTVDEFEHSVAKYVRKGHITSNKHWKYKQVDKNLLA